MICPGNPSNSLWSPNLFLVLSYPVFHSHLCGEVQRLGQSFDSLSRWDQTSAQMSVLQIPAAKLCCSKLICECSAHLESITNAESQAPSHIPLGQNHFNKIRGGFQSVWKFEGSRSRILFLGSLFLFGSLFLDQLGPVINSSMVLVPQ